MSEASFLVVEDVARLLRRSVRSVHELTRTEAIPHRRLSRTRRCLFVESELLAWLDGAKLEKRKLAGGGRVVKPKENGRP